MQRDGLNNLGSLQLPDKLFRAITSCANCSIACGLNTGTISGVHPVTRGTRQRSRKTKRETGGEEWPRAVRRSAREREGRLIGRLGFFFPTKWIHLTFLSPSFSYRNVEDYAREHEEASRNIQQYLSNPINAYLLVKRLTTDWKRVEELITEDVGKSFVANITNSRSDLKFPTDEDLNGAAVALMRLQDTYKLETAQVAKGVLNGVQYSTGLTGTYNISTCFFFRRIVRIGVCCAPPSGARDPDFPAGEIISRARRAQGRFLSPLVVANSTVTNRRNSRAIISRAVCNNDEEPTLGRRECTLRRGSPPRRRTAHKGPLGATRVTNKFHDAQLSSLRY